MKSYWFAVLFPLIIMKKEIEFISDENEIIVNEECERQESVNGPRFFCY